MFHRLSYNNWDWDDQNIYVAVNGEITGALIDTNIVQTYKSINDI